MNMDVGMGGFYRNVSSQLGVKNNVSKSVSKDYKQGAGMDSVRSKLRETERENRKQAAQEKKPAQYGSNVVNSMLTYSKNLNIERTKKADTAIQVKKMKYIFKALSSQIVKSKTSNSAKQLERKAHREVVNLKKQLQSAGDEKDEIMAAINHAQAMERVARKKAKHLQMEEMVKETGKGTTEEIGQEKEISEEAKKPEEASKMTAESDELEAIQAEQEAQLEAVQAEQEAQLEAMQAEQAAQLEAMQEELLSTSSIEEMTEEMLSEEMAQMLDEMSEMLTESGLEELEEITEVAVPKEMDSADLKQLKAKHRAEEEKAIAKADSEYLKVMFEKYESMKTGGVAPSGVGNVGMSSPISVDVAPTVSTQPIDVGFDMSV